VLPTLRDYRVLRSNEHISGRRARTAVPHPEGIEWHAQQVGECALREARGLPQVSEVGHGDTMPLAFGVAKRPPACMTGAFAHARCGPRFREISARSNRSVDANARIQAHTRKTDHLFRFAFARK
jgi:hypothetical protein